MTEVMAFQGDSTCLQIGEQYENQADLVMFDPMYKSMLGQKSIQPKRKKNMEETIFPICPPKQDYDDWYEKWIINASKCVKPSGWVIIKLDDYTARACFNIASKHLQWSNTIVWDKGIIGNGRLLRKQHEVLEVFRPINSKESPYWGAARLTSPGKTLKSRTHGNGTGKAVSTVWKIFRPNGGNFGQATARYVLLDGVKKKLDHPNRTPLALWKKAIITFCPAAGTVIDLCMGSGSIGMAAKLLGRTYYGWELQTELYQFACNNLEKTADLGQGLRAYV